MSHPHKLSLFSAILVNLNVMFGTGIFINTVILTQKAGALSFIGYPLIALLALPLTIAMAKLVEKYPSGGFYEYCSKELSPLWGFCATWSYLFGKLASGTLMVHVFSRLIQTIIRPLSGISTISIDLGLIAFLGLLNLSNLKTGKQITYTFVILKFIPTLFVILSGITLYHGWKIDSTLLLWDGIPATLPLILYAFCGFEVCCSLTRHMQNPKTDGPKAILYSYGISIAISTLYQLFFFLSAGTQLAHATDYLQAYPTLFRVLFVQNTTITILTTLFHCAAAASALGSSYGILFSNTWNFYELAAHKHLIGWKHFLKLNQHHIPFLCVAAEIGIYLLYLAISGGKQIILQQVASLGVTITYILCVVSYIQIQKRTGTSKSQLLGYAAFASCMIFLITSIQGLLRNGISGLILFSIALGSGIVMFYAMSEKKIVAEKY